MSGLPTLRQMQFLTALARAESFSRAAEACHVSQSTLSAGIKEMELQLGAALIDRSGRRFALTPLGADTVRRAETVLTLTREMVRAAEARPPLTGALRLGIIPTIAPFLLPLLAPRLSRDYPALGLSVREEITERLLDDLRAGRLDMALLALPVPGADAAGGLETTVFADDPFVLLAPSDHPLAARSRLHTRDLADTQLLLLEDGHCLRDHALSACNLQDRQVAEAFGATSLYTLAQLVRAGAGVTLAPRLAVARGLADDAGLVAVPLADGEAEGQADGQMEGRGGTPSRALGLAWRRGSGREAEAEALVRVLRAATEEAMQGGAPAPQTSIAASPSR